MKSDAPQGGQQNAVPFLKTPAVYTATQRKGSKEKVKVLAHGADFKKHGIAETEIPQYIMAAVKYGAIVGYQGRGQGRPIYEFIYEGTRRRIAITIGSNGYVVGANPKSMPKEEKP